MTNSLRLRLFLIIVLPLLALAVIAGAWRLSVARDTAQEMLDRNLMLTALTVVRDVARSDGDAISLETDALLRKTVGGLVRYHVYGPDGVLVTGYAVPPVPLSRKLPTDKAYAYYDAVYRGEPARVLRLKDETTIGGVTGTYTVTVWQDLASRNAFVTQLVLRSVAVILTLILGVGMLVWFGVRLGLKPLLELEDAISQRSSEDLSPIRRSVPVETRGLVARLNELFSQVNTTLAAQTNFVSDAAHQLRNPIAGLRALADATTSAPTLDAARSRAREMSRAASEAGDLANRLLTLERARAEAQVGAPELLSLSKLVEETASALRASHGDRGVALTVDMPAREVTVPGDAVMLREALTNLIDNAYVHGGPGLREISVTMYPANGHCDLVVENDGRSVPPSAVPKILARFGQDGTGEGSGLGLSIAEAVSRRHAGTLSVLERDEGFAVRIRLPLVQSEAKSNGPGSP